MGAAVGGAVSDDADVEGVVVSDELLDLVSMIFTTEGRPPVAATGAVVSIGVDVVGVTVSDVLIPYSLSYYGKVNWKLRDTHQVFCWLLTCVT